MRFIKYFLIMLFALALIPSVAQAAQFRSAQENLTIDKDQSPKDLYIAGSNVTINSKVGGDLLVAGNSIIVDGDVENSLFVVGGTVTIRGNIGRHLRIVANNIIISGNVGGDLFAAGGTILINKDVAVVGDFYGAANSITINGKIGGQSYLRASTLSVQGQTGLINATLSKSLSVGKDALISKDLIYKAPTQASIDSNAKILGKTNYSKTANFPFKNLISIWYLVQLLGTILLLFLVIKFFPKTANLLVDQSIKKSWVCLLAGVLTLFIAPILLIILLFTFIGIPAVLFIGSLWGAVIAVGSLLGKLLAGYLIYNVASKGKITTLSYQMAAVGALAIFLITMVPFLGGTLNLLLMVLGIGSVVLFLGKFSDEKIVS